MTGSACARCGAPMDASEEFRHQCGAPAATPAATSLAAPPPRPRSRRAMRGFFLGLAALLLLLAAPFVALLLADMTRNTPRSHLLETIPAALAGLSLITSIVALAQSLLSLGDILKRGRKGLPFAILGIIFSGGVVALVLLLLGSLAVAF